MMNKINAFFNKLLNRTDTDRGYEEHAQFATVAECPQHEHAPLKETTVVFEGEPPKWQRAIGRLFGVK